METKLFKNIGFCTDFSENADQAFTVARDLAVQFGASIEIIHVTVNFSLSPPVHSTYMPIEYDPQFIEEVAQSAMKSIRERYVEKIPPGLPYNVNISPDTRPRRYSEQWRKSHRPVGHGIPRFNGPRPRPFREHCGQGGSKSRMLGAYGSFSQIVSPKQLKTSVKTLCKSAEQIEAG